MTDADTIAQQVSTYIVGMDHVTFAELERKFPLLFNGSLDLTLPGLAELNVILWPQVSELGSQVFRLLQLNPRLIMDVTPPLVYLMDGIVPDLPLAMEPIKYAEKHWLPAVWRCRKESDGARTPEQQSLLMNSILN